MRAKLITVKTLRKLLELHHATGQLYWKARPASMFQDGGFGGAQASANSWNSKNAGSAAFTLMQNGYRAGKVMGQQVYAHQVVFALVHGRWPSGEVDHINGNRGDNRPENLRECLDGENHRNKAKGRRNASGVLGVYWHKGAGKWAASIRSKGVREHLGLFASLEDAAAARRDAETRLGFHSNHGRDAP